VEIGIVIGLNNHKEHARKNMIHATRSLNTIVRVIAGLSLAMLASCQPQGEHEKAASASKAAPTSPAAAIVLKDWGPRETKPGTGFNLQPGNISAIWISVSGVANHPDTQVLWDGKPLEQVVITPALVTAAVPNTLYKAAGTYPIQIKEGGSDRVVNVGTFFVKDR
jgi:hypothetical protein